LNGWIAIGKASAKADWTIRAACLKAARDSKDKYHSNAVGALAEAWGIARPTAVQMVQDYELYLQSVARTTDAATLPRSVYRTANEAIPTPPKRRELTAEERIEYAAQIADATDAKVTALADYRERKAVDPGYSVRQFAADIPKGAVKPVREMIGTPVPIYVAHLPDY